MEKSEIVAHLLKGLCDSMSVSVCHAGLLSCGFTAANPHSQLRFSSLLSSFSCC